MSRSICTYPDCGRPVNSNGLCSPHARQAQRGTPLHPIGQRTLNHPDTCTVDGCTRDHYCKGYCLRHYQASRRHAGNPTATGPRKPANDKLPGGWNGRDKTRPTGNGSNTPHLDVGPVIPNTTEELRLLDACLTRHHAHDLASMLGIEAA